MANLINKIHVNNSTNLSLNDRFTAISKVKPKPRDQPKASKKNLNLVQQLAKKHKITLRTQAARRITRSNSVTNVAARIGTRRLSAGSILQARGNVQNRLRSDSNARRGRPAGVALNQNRFNVQKTQNNRQSRSRSRSRSRATSITQTRRSTSRSQNRSRSRSRGRQGTPVKTRLGFNATAQPRGQQKNNSNLMKKIKSRNNIPQQVGVLAGRITKRRTSIKGGVKPNGGHLKNIGPKQRLTRPQRNENGGLTGVRRGRSQSKQRVTANLQTQRNRKGGPNGKVNGRRPTAPNRRTRSRTRDAKNASSRTARGLAQKPGIKKEDLDKELDQYMANTNTDLDYIMGNS